jgi:hypothetical protein
VTEQRGDFASIDSAALPVVATAPENPSVAESELLIACATWERTPARTERVRSAIRDIVWDRWVPRARAHRLVPHVHRQLDLLDELVPDAVRDQLREETRAIAVRALRLAAQLSELATAFEAVSIPLIAYKGPALSLAAYGDIGVRASVDLDVVVAPGNIDRAREVLRALGYASRAGMTPAQEHALQRSFGHFVYARDDASAPLELHWRFASPHYPWTFAPTTVSARASRIEIGGAVVLVPSALDEIVLQAMHGTRHQWDQLEWLVAFAALLVASASPAAIPLLLERAVQQHARRPLLLGARLAHELLGAVVPDALLAAVVPDALLAAASADAAVVRRADEIIARFLRGAPPYSARENRRYCLELMEHRADRVRFVAEEIFRPTMREWELVRLPGVLTPLYWPIRLGRLLFRGGVRR